MNIWSPDNLVKSLEDKGKPDSASSGPTLTAVVLDSAFGFLSITKESVADLSRKAREPAIVQLMRSDLDMLQQRNNASEL
jgi:hypothetical protein